MENSITKSRILIIEDDGALLRGVRDNLVAQGFEVETATDGAAGLAAALHIPPDLVVLDIMLPRMSGFDVCRHLRSQQQRMPIIMLTAKGQEEDIVRGLEMGADDYVTKPFSIRELVARVRAFLRRTHAASETTHLGFGPFALDVDARTLTKDGGEVVLTKKEFELLEYFLKHPGRALTRNEIMDHVWGRAVIVTARSVDRCVTTLRSKIEPDTQHPRFIRTVRDIGYRFVADDSEPLL